MDLNELLVFHAVAQEKSVSGAARKTGMPKSTISRKLNQLEERLGVRLLNRSTRVVELTEAGQLYYPHCAQMLAAAQDAERVVAAVQQEPAGLLRITAPNSFGRSLTGRIIHDFIRAYPKIEMDIILTNETLDLITLNIDAAFRLGPLSDSSLIARRWMAAPRVLVSSPDYLAEHGAPQSVEDLEHHELLSVHGLPWHFTAHPDFTGAQLRTRLNINDVDFVKRLVVKGMGIAILPIAACFRELQSGDLVNVMPDTEVSADAFYLVYPSRDQMPQKLRAFLDFVVAWSKAEPPWQDFYRLISAGQAEVMPSFETED